jgi:glycolate oxidase
VVVSSSVEQSAKIWKGRKAAVGAVGRQCDYYCMDGTIPLSQQPPGLRAERAGAEILKLCVSVGGCLSGEHGIGIEKRDLMRVQFSEWDLAVQMRIKSVFDPDWLLNPGKVFPLDARTAAHLDVGRAGDVEAA